MIIKKVHITKFRGFNNVEFELGSQITVIAGQNGTQKTTLLGILSQTFSLNKKSAMFKEKPLCGGNYRSSFNDKFKLSSKFDLPKSHEWSLYINGSSDPFTVESILRDKETMTIRFWKKGSKDKGDGYLQYPTIYLSLKRLLPIGEDHDISQSSKISLSDEEKNLFVELHNRILHSQETIKET